MSEAVTETTPARTVGAKQPVHTGAVRTAVDSVWVERRPDQGLWVLGVTFKGSDHVFAARKLGGIDDDIQEAAQPGYRAAKAEAYQNQLRDERG